jgi:hypothetical protein
MFNIKSVDDLKYIDNVYKAIFALEITKEQKIDGLSFWLSYDIGDFIAELQEKDVLSDEILESMPDEYKAIPLKKSIDLDIKTKISHYIFDKLNEECDIVFDCPIFSEPEYYYLLIAFLMSYNGNKFQSVELFALLEENNLLTLGDNLKEKVDNEDIDTLLLSFRTLLDLNGIAYNQQP